jgi:hypothetical protein
VVVRRSGVRAPEADAPRREDSDALFMPAAIPDEDLTL